MLSFANDYQEGAHEKILQRLIETNLEPVSGYGTDPYCEHAKEKMMQNILHKEEKRELEQVSFSFQIPISLSILTHLTRHRMHPLLIPEFVPLWNMENYIIPETIKKNANDVYQKAVNENIKMFEEFKEASKENSDCKFFSTTKEYIEYAIRNASKPESKALRDVIVTHAVQYASRDEIDTTRAFLLKNV